MTTQAHASVVVPIAEEFYPYMDSALARFSYLWPGADPQVSEDQATVTIIIDDTNVDAAVRDLKFSLYREKIYSDTLSLRTSLVQGLMGK